MDNHSVVLKFDPALCPTTNAGSIMLFGKAIADYLRTKDRGYLPPGVTVLPVAAPAK